MASASFDLGTSASFDLGTEDCSRTLQIWDQMCKALQSHGRLHLFADFDGTLSELVSTPHEASLDRDAKLALRRLYASGVVTVAIISGRSVDDVASRVGLPVVYGGDHGFEIHAPDFHFVVPEGQEFRRKLPELSNRLRDALRSIPGVLVESKRFSASVHYRQVAKEHVSAIEDIVRSCVQPSSFQIRSGACVFEVRPRMNWGKGDAVRWLLERYGAGEEQAICIGDDETDEDMFRSAPDAVNVRVVGSSEAASHARCYVSRAGVATFLHGIADLAEGLLSDNARCEARTLYGSSLTIPA